MAFNGNGPVRVSTYADARACLQKEPGRRRRGEGARERARGFPALPGGRPRAGDLPRGGSTRRLGRKPVKEAVAAIIQRVKPLMPA